jgi:hypothetical protein
VNKSSNGSNRDTKVRLNPTRIYAWAWYLLLTGLMFLDKPFAYLRLGPIFISDLVLLFGVTVCAGRLLTRRAPAGLRAVRWPSIALIAFVGYELLRTSVDVPVWGRAALRDGAVWGYAGFTVCALILISPHLVDRGKHLYARILPYFMCWAPIASLLLVLRPWDTNLPGTNVSIYAIKPGDLAVHLAGAGIFFVLGLTTRRPTVRWLLAGAWSLAWFLLANLSRGALIATVAGIGAAFVLRPRRRVTALAVGVAVVWLAFGVSGAHLDRPKYTDGMVAKEISARNFGATFASLYELGVRGLRREVSRAGSPTEVESVRRADGESTGATSTAESEEPLRSETVAWRLAWWRTIVDYTVFGDYRWTGKGFGVNLADDDGFQVRRDRSLRSPHNVFMTVLARSGLPGLALFVWFIGALLTATVRAVYRRGPGSLALVWIVGYFIASLVNGCFDVYIENPMGGVWFWSLAGIALVMVRHIRSEESKGSEARNVMARAR